LRLGLIGLGGFGLFILEALAPLEEIEVAALADPEEERLGRARELWARLRPQAPPPRECRTAGELLDQVDAVWVATPPSLHHPLGVEALQRGKMLFLEKPGSLTLGEMDHLIELSRSRRLPAGVDFVLRAHPLYLQLRRWMAEGLFGPLERFSLENDARDDHLPPGHWFWEEEKSGGIWVEHGVHFFDLVHWLARPEGFSLCARSLLRPEGWKDTVMALVEYRSPSFFASFAHHFTRPREFERTRIHLVFRRAYIEVEGWIPTSLRGRAWLEEEALDRLLQTPGLEVEYQKSHGGKVFLARGRPLPVDREVGFGLAIRDREEAYRQSLRRGITALLRGRPLAPLRAARRALEVALEAREGSS